MDDASPCVNVLDAILGHARRSPRHPAAKDLDRDLDYGQLVEAVQELAAGLAAEGVGPGDRVALHLPNSVDFVVAALACQWLGAAFVPLSMADPLARLAVVVGDCQPDLVVASDGSDPTALPEGARSRRREMTELARSQAPRVPQASESAIAYATYTSGTLGTPKGVLIGSGAFAAAVKGAVDALGLSPATRALCVSPFHFDGSYATLFSTLYAGGSTVIRPRDALLYPRTFFNAVAKEAITYAGFSPSYLRILLSSPQVGKLAGTTLEIVALGGEAISASDLRALWAAAPQVQVYNRYGPTETTIAVTNTRVTPDMVARGVVPFGRPHAGVTFYLLNDDGRLIDEPDQIGELYIGGCQLMLGYWDAPELTAGVIRQDVVPGETLYRTGDLVYRDGDGDYVYVGRVDQVVKRRGVRISLTELSEAVQAIEGVAAAACVAYDAGGQTGVAAFVVGVLDPSQLWSASRERLPDTMVPDPFIVVDQLPLTGSGKLDTRGLIEAAGLRPDR